jgi:hypothetical protein
MDAGEPGVPLVAASASADTAAVAAAPVSLSLPRAPVAVDKALGQPVHEAARPGAAVPRALPVPRDGFAVEHGILTAVRSPIGSAAAQPTPAALPVPVALPEGIRPDDAVVSPAGIVTIVRANGSTPQAQPAPAPTDATVDDAAASPFRATVATHSP